MYSEEALKVIENAIKDLFRLVFDVEVKTKSSLSLRGVEIEIDCDKAHKGKILGRKGTTMRVVRRLIRIMCKYRFKANVNVNLLPDLEVKQS